MKKPTDYRKITGLLQSLAVSLLALLFLCLTTFKFQVNDVIRFEESTLLSRIITTPDNQTIYLEVGSEEFVLMGVKEVYVDFSCPSGDLPSLINSKHESERKLTAELLDLEYLPEKKLFLLIPVWTTRERSRDESLDPSTAWQNAQSNKKRILFLELKYPYGKPRVFQSGSLFAVAARLDHMGHEVSVVDLNIHSETSRLAKDRIENADYICISLTGTPYLPDAIEFAHRAKDLGTPIIFGGQGSETLSQEQFNSLFASTNSVRVTSDLELFQVIGNVPTNPLSVFQVGYKNVLANLDNKSMRTYLENEMTLVISQGCLYRCKFCAAKKARKEVFRDLKKFEDDLRYIAIEAKQRDISTLNFYASSLDFFQSALVDKGETTIEKVLRVMAKVRNETGVDIKTRCLSTLASFLKAAERIPELGTLLAKAGLYRIGFGVDGTDPSIWKSQGKNHNKPHQILECIKKTKEFDVCAEILMVVGFPEDTWKTLVLNVQSAVRYSQYPNVILRAYMAKTIAPGNEGWNSETAQPFLEDPTKFQQIDYCAFASKTTHPNWKNRFLSNLCYGALMGIFMFSNRSVTYPVFPIRGNFIKRSLARFLNNQMPGVD